MLTTSNVTSSSALQGAFGEGRAPETGEFDFMNYLLGLQDANPDATQVDGLNVLDSKVEEATGKGQGAEKESANGTSEAMTAWNPLFPGLATSNTGSANTLTNPTGVDEKGEKNKDVQESAFAIRNGNETTLGSQFGATAASSRSEEGNAESKGVPVQRDWAMQKYGENLNRFSTENANPANYAQHQLDTVESANNSQPSSMPMNLREAQGTELASDEDDKKARLDGSVSLASLQHNAAPSPKEWVSAPNAKAEVVPTTVPEVFNKVESLVHHGGGKMTVSLNPPDLGQVEIHVKARGNKVEIEMKSESSHAKTLIESHMNDLKNSIESQDLVVSKMEVNVAHDLGRHAADFAATTGGYHQSGSQGYSGNQQGSRNFLNRGELPQLSRSQVTATPVAARAMGTSRVDLRI